MALATKKSDSKTSNPIHTDTEQGVANTELISTLAAVDLRKLLHVGVTLSGATGTTTATIVLDSGRGAVYDIELGTIAISGGDEGIFYPTVETYIQDDDSLVVTVPAAGASAVPQVQIQTEVLH